MIFSAFIQELLIPVNFIMRKCSTSDECCGNPITITSAQTGVNASRFVTVSTKYAALNELMNIQRLHSTAICALCINQRYCSPDSNSYKLLFWDEPAKKMIPRHSAVSAPVPVNV